MIEATVKTCPPGGGFASTVLVQLAVDENLPQPGTSDSGGHAHDTRPARVRGTLDASECTATLNAQGVGSCSVTYRSSEVSSVETIVGSAAGFTNATAKIRVQIPGLVKLPAAQYYRLTGQTAGHPDNHWGTPYTMEKVRRIAFDYFADFGATLGINDMSLQTGSLFDTCGTWRQEDTCPNALGGGHSSHRTGTGVDIDTSVFKGGVKSPLPRDFIERRCRNNVGYLLREASFHCEFSQ